MSEVITLDAFLCFHRKVVVKAIRGFPQPGHLAALDFSKTTS
jgi:hypothetical protein